MWAAGGPGQQQLHGQLHQQAEPPQPGTPPAGGGATRLAAHRPPIHGRSRGQPLPAVAEPEAPPASRGRRRPANLS